MGLLFSRSLFHFEFLLIIHFNICFLFQNMFNFIKKAGTTTTSDKDEKERRKKDKKERKEKKRDRLSMTTDEVLRLDEVRRSLKIRGRRKEKEKLPSGITADYSANFFASYDRSESPSNQGNSNNIWSKEGLTQSDSSETSLNSLNNPQISGKNLPPVPPRPPKRGILKGPRVSITREIEVVEFNGEGSSDLNNLIQNTLRNEVIAYQLNANGVQEDPNMAQMSSNNLLVITSTSPSADSLTDTTTNSSFATPPFSLSPVGESQGFHRWTRASNFEENLPLPPILSLQLPKPRVLTIMRQPAPRSDFGFSLRRAMIVERNFSGLPGPNVQMKAVIFAEPGAIVQHCNETGLLPGDRLLEVNSVCVDDKSREEIIDLIKSSKDHVTVKVSFFKYLILPRLQLSSVLHKSAIQN